MKIEKINDRQIRCTLTREDLASRQIKISELAYGTEKAKALFQDMMRMAARDFGFEADDMPLMIEAIPLSMDALLLVITKVDDPEELDTRFSQFSPDNDTQPSGTFTNLLEHIEGADDILDLIHRISEAKNRASAKSADTAHKSIAQKDTPAGAEPTAESEDPEMPDLTRFYLFHTLDDVIRAAQIIGSIYDGTNTLYKNTEDGEYYLILRKDGSTATDFNKICNILSEYALSCKYTPGMDAYFAEHMEVTVPDQALQKLRQLA
jgi:adapter protein MecA 1/2